MANGIVEIEWIRLYDSIKPLNKKLVDMNRYQKEKIKHEGEELYALRSKISHRKYYLKTREMILHEMSKQTL